MESEMIRLQNSAKLMHEKMYFELASDIWINNNLYIKDS